MKKLILVLALMTAFAGSAFAQPASSWKSGVTHKAAPGYLTGDSVHTFGTISLINPNGTRRDSLSIGVSYNDSLRFALVLKLKNAFGTVTDTASVTIVGGDKIIDVTAAGQTIFPWFAIRGAFGDKIHGAAEIVVSGIVYAVGTEGIVYQAATRKNMNVRSLVWE